MTSTWLDVFVGVVVIIAIIWLVQRYGRAIHEPTFHVKEEFKQEHDDAVKQGRSLARERRVIIAGMLRDGEDSIPHMLEKCRHLGSLFKEYKILVVENDSKDNTRKLLLDQPDIEVLGCGVNVSSCKYNDIKTDGHIVAQNRMEKMARLRNIYLERVQQHYADWEYMCVIDMDLLSTIYDDGVYNTLYWMDKKKADAMCGNGVYTLPGMQFYYDTFAHINLGDRLFIKNKPAHDLGTVIELGGCSPGDRPSKVTSCFSGITFYKIPSLMGLKYDIDPVNVECEHVRLHRHLNTYFNPSMMHHIRYNP